MCADVYIVDDDPFLSCTTKQIVEDLGLSCETFSSLESFESVFPGPTPKCVIVDLAIPLGNSSLIDPMASKAGFESGMELLRRLRKEWSEAKLMLMTGNPSSSAQKWCSLNDVVYALKPVARETVERVLSLRNLRAFVVHGRDTKALQKTKNVLAKIGVEPVVLMECSNLGRTIIEKFEDVSNQCDCAVVVLSPDDFGNLAGESVSAAQPRARQNVIFELGYFCGALGRRSGRVVLLGFGDLEIPSDLSGVIYLDGKNETADIASELQRELDHLQ